MLGRWFLAGTAALALLAVAGVDELTAALPRNRTIALHNIHTKETLRVEYARDGRHIPEAMAKINWLLRDWRRDESTEMDPALIDLLWEMHAELGSAEPIHIISGYRSRATNELLRKTVGGQASESRHILGKAADVFFPDVPLKRLRYSALLRERGGVGYYPTSATPFVHLDTDRVRAWPRLPRFELALLFPSGRSQHLPAEGGPIGPDDVKIAQSRYRELAVQVAEYLGTRRDPGLTAVASAAPAAGGRAAVPPTANRQVAALAAIAPPPPRIADRPSRFVPRPSDTDRTSLAKLAALAAEPQLVHGPAPAVRPPRPNPASLGSIASSALPTGLRATAAAPPPAAARLAAIDPAAHGGSLTDAGNRFGWGSGWAQAPAFDDEHPEELSYRPFPLAPYMTETASPDDPALVKLVEHDPARTLELLDQAGQAPPLRLRPGIQDARLLWAQHFQVRAGDGPSLPAAAGSEPALAARKVATSAQN